MLSIACCGLFAGSGLHSHENIAMSYCFSLLRFIVSVLTGENIVLSVSLVAPFAVYRWMRPLPASLVNSDCATPIFLTRHSSASQLPVTIAIFGMSPSSLVLGSEV